MGEEEEDEDEEEEEGEGAEEEAEGKELACLRVSVVVWGMMVSAGASFQQQAGAGASRQARTRPARP